jgi:hypothetical protein
MARKKAADDDDEKDDELLEEELGADEPLEDDEPDESAPVNERVELAAFLGDDVSRRRCLEAKRSLPQVENQAGDWFVGLCTLAKKWPEELTRQATGRAALAMAKIVVRSAEERDRHTAGDAPKRLLSAAQMALVGDKEAARKTVADLFRPDLLQLPEPARGLRAAALLTFQQAFAGKPEPGPLTAIANTFLQSIGADGRKSAWKALKQELRDTIVPWALGRPDPLQQ